MPIALSAEQRALLRSGALAIRTLIDLHFDGGRVSVWDGHEHFAFDGVTYVACADFGEISAISLGQDLGAEGVELRLNGTRLLEASPDPFDLAAVFGTVEQENYQLRRVDIRFAFFDADTGALALLVRRFAGFIDQIRQVEEVGDDGQMTSWLIVSCESIARRYGVFGGRTRSHDDQLDIWAGDTGFKFTANAVMKSGTLYWGRMAPNQSKSGGLRGRAERILGRLR